MPAIADPYASRQDASAETHCRIARSPTSLPSAYSPPVPATKASGGALRRAV